LEAVSRRRFTGSGWLYRDLDFAAEAGTVVAVVGPNGSGKSTLMRDVVGITEPSSGRVCVDRDDVRAMTPRARARTISYLPQHHDFPHDLPVQDVVALGRAPHRGLFGGPDREDRAAIDRALAATDTAHLSGRGLLTLSGGERQRVLLARMLATDTPILVLDEPTTALDVGHALALLGRLRDLADEGRTVLFSAHDLEHARRIADQVLVLHGGESGESVFGPVETTLVPRVLDDVFDVRTTVDERGLSFQPRHGVTD
jgi:iron complex transport system ATP-binding protein